MRVVHFLWDGGLGGVQRYLRSMLVSPAWSDVEHLLCLGGERGAVIGSSFTGARVLELGIRGVSDLQRIGPILKVLADRPDVVHLHLDSPPIVAAAALSATRRIVYDEHGDTLMRRHRRRPVRAVLHAASFRWHRIVVHSRFVAETMTRLFPEHSQKLELVPYPVLDAPTEPGPWPRAPRVGVFARLVWQKGLDWVLEVAERVHRQVPEFSLHVFGEGPERSAIERDIARRGLRDVVVLRGFEPAPLRAMAELACVLIPSRIEPFGLVAVEALSVGVPVIGFRESGVADSVVDGESGFLVSMGDLTAMSSALVRLLSEPGLAGRFGSTGSEHARRRPSMEAHVATLRRLYQG